MSPRRPLQAVQSSAHRGACANELGQRYSDGPVVFTFAGPFFRTDEAAAYLQYRGKHRLRSLYRFLAEKGVPIARRSRRAILIKKVDLDRAIGATTRRSA